MPALSPRAQALITAFGQQPGVTPDQAKNLQGIVNGSPVLIDQINDAVAQEHLKHIVPLANPHAGGEYSPTHKEMRLPLAKLTSPPDVGDMTFVLGHELRHGFNATGVRQAGIDFAKDVRAIAKGNGAIHDYTPAMAQLLAANRRDEAGAEIAGWNAVVGEVKSTNTNPGLGDIYERTPGRMADFIDRTGNYPHYAYALKSNLNLNADMTMPPTSANVEAMGQNYFDKPPKHPGGLGPSGNADYVNYYGATLMGYVAEVERSYNPPKQGVPSPHMTFNMSHLRLSEKLLEEKGIDLGRNNTGQQAYYDSSSNPPTSHLFQHTISTHQHTNPILAETVQEDRSRPELQASTLNPDDPSHPNHAMLGRIRAGVRAIEENIGKCYGEASERITRSLLAACKDNREMYSGERDISLSCYALNRVDHVVMGTTGNIFAVEGRLDDPAHSRAYVPVAQALQIPVEQSDRKLEMANQQIAQEQVMALQQMQAHGLDNPTANGPAMTR